MRTLCIVNPVAGSGRGKKAWEQVAPTLASLHPEVAWTERAGHATEIARRACGDGFTHLIAVGGDGTIHEVVNGMDGAETALAIIPAGTANDFARSAGIPFRAVAAATGLQRDRRRAVDVGVCHGQRYLNVAGAGFDAEVARKINAGPRRSRGAVPYVWTAVRLAFRYDSASMRLNLDGRELRQRFLVVAVGNASAYGGGMRICPRAVIDDGLLDVCMVGHLKGTQILRILPKVFLGRHIHHPAVRYERAQHVRIDSESPDADVAVHADGELVGGLPIAFTLQPGACTLWMPAG